MVQRRIVEPTGHNAAMRIVLKTRAVLTRGGKKLDTCELKRVRWTAAPTG